MTRNVTELSNLARFALAAAMCAAATPVAAQDDSKVVTNRDPGVVDVASTPLQDLNLTKDDIPEALRDAVTAPYASEKLATCKDIRREVLRLDDVLGDDLDIASGEANSITIGKIAKSAVASFIPFRGVVRQLTGAADHQREFEKAILAGVIRRSFLKGIGEMRDCPYPARPASTRITFDDDVTDANTAPAESPDTEND